MRLKVFIVDDELNFIYVLSSMLMSLGYDIEIVGKAIRVDLAIPLIRKHTPDILFLDVEMPLKTGFDLLDEFSNPNFKVIFITGHSEYAIKAIKYSALDYILKPIDKEELSEAIERCINEFDDQQTRIKNLKQQLSSTTPDHLLIYSLEGVKKLFFKDIMYIEARSGNYSIFHTSDHSIIMTTKPLNYYESFLPQSIFFRNHRSTMVNISKVTTWNSLKSLVTLVNGKVLTVSFRKRSALLAHLKNNP